MKKKTWYYKTFPQDIRAQGCVVITTSNQRRVLTLCAGWVELYSNRSIRKKSLLCSIKDSSYHSQSL